MGSAAWQYPFRNARPPGSRLSWKNSSGSSKENAAYRLFGAGSELLTNTAVSSSPSTRVATTAASTAGCICTHGALTSSCSARRRSGGARSPWTRPPRLHNKRLANEGGWLQSLPNVNHESWFAGSRPSQDLTLLEQRNQPLGSILNLGTLPADRTATRNTPPGEQEAAQHRELTPKIRQCSDPLTPGTQAF